ncbi:hypothetical protein M422DRAFT_168409, partial [Sphaerobolus stellatus SS14]
GSNNNTFSYVDLAGNTFTRKVNASANVILLDQQGGNLAPVKTATSTPVFTDQQGFAGRIFSRKKIIVHSP